jgi:hypothetical protein
MPSKGDVFCFSEGSYSDYHLTGHFTATADFSMEEQSSNYLKIDLGTWKKMSYWDYSVRPASKRPVPIEVDEPIPHDVDGFQAFLIRQGLAEPADVKEFYTGDYHFGIIKDIT